MGEGRQAKVKVEHDGYGDRPFCVLGLASGGSPSGTRTARQEEFVVAAWLNGARARKVNGACQTRIEEWPDHPDRPLTDPAT